MAASVFETGNDETLASPPTDRVSLAKSRGKRYSPRSYFFFLAVFFFAVFLAFFAFFAMSPSMNPKDG